MTRHFARIGPRLSLRLSVRNEYQLFRFHFWLRPTSESTCPENLTLTINEMFQSIHKECTTIWNRTQAHDTSRKIGIGMCPAELWRSAWFIVWEAPTSADSAAYISQRNSPVYGVLIDQAFNASIRGELGSFIPLYALCRFTPHRSRLLEVYRGQKVAGAFEQISSLVPNVWFPSSWMPSRQSAIRVFSLHISLRFNGIGKLLSCFKKDMIRCVGSLPYFFSAWRPICSIPIDHLK